ncbi:MAG: PorP/SprF family type IX secretion system membrane protein [Bacteroidetes bacterium]|nr:PorP/SprF family type IX secretion system membrane protein [Bacteroidota bacterium]
MFLFIVAFASAQQTPNYVQYIFNKSGINPAASGVNINQKYNYTFGGNRQWIDFNNAPKQTFANFSYTIKPPRSYSYWQNIGGMVERDQSGNISNNGIYLSYTIHLLLRKNLVTSFGIFAGMREFYLSPGLIDPMDPIAKSGTFRTLVYPDLIPGMRLSSKKFFFDISARQVSINKQQDFKGNMLGGPSRLNPTFFVAYGRVFPVNDYMIMLPSIAVNMALVGVPAISPTLMFYYSNRFGFGASMRNASFISGIFQVRIFQNLSIGLSYSYSTNKVGFAARNSYEIMVGVVPMGLSDKNIRGRSVAKCPGLDF